MFGIRESSAVVKAKVGLEEEEIRRNRELWSVTQNFMGCEFWLEFEDGGKLLVEMIEKVEANLNDIPLQAPEANVFSKPELLQERQEDGGDTQQQQDPATVEATGEG